MAQHEKPLWQDAVDYVGVLSESGTQRLAISPNGKRYLLQVKANDQAFAVRKACKWLHRLVPSLPPSLAQAVGGLPDDPLEYPRPWAQKIAAQSQRVRRANSRCSEYIGTICTEGDARLVILVDRRVYALQAFGENGWRNLVTSVGSERIIGALFVRYSVDSLKEPLNDKLALQSAAVRLPRYASRYPIPTGAETLATAASLPRGRVGRETPKASL